MPTSAGWVSSPAITAAVARWTGPQGQTVVTFGDVAASDDVILMIHGMAGCKERFLAVALACVDAGKAVISVDLPYHGERRTEPHGSIMLYPPHPQFMKVSASVCNMLLSELPGILDAVGVTSDVTVLGHSLGGRIAYHMALRSFVWGVQSASSPSPKAARSRKKTMATGKTSIHLPGLRACAASQSRSSMEKKTKSARFLRLNDCKDWFVRRSGISHLKSR